MALLNLKKKDEEKKEAPSDVPDELPPLPDDDKGDEKKEGDDAPTEGDAPPDEVKAEEAKEEAPDELPPLEEEPPKEEPTASPASDEPVTVDDDTLYFTDLAKKITSAGNLDEIHSMLQGEVLQGVQEKYQENKTSTDLQSVQSEITKVLEPLKQLESSWRGLKKEVAEKSEKIQSIEEEINEKTKDLSGLLEKAAELKKNTE